MRVIVFFDLPSVSVVDKREYIKFRKFLLTDGVVMMQASVYSKITLNMISAEAVKKRIENNKPKTGLVQILVITEKQYASIDYLCGSAQTTIIDSDKRLIIF